MSTRDGAAFYQGIYKMENPSKYIGGKAPMMRSGWEFKFARFLDLNDNVVKWASEHSKTVIPYKYPDGSNHRYIPDFWVEMRLRGGEVRKFLIEIKPSKESPYHVDAPKEPKRKTAKALRNYGAKLRTYMINKCKWDAAEEWCKKRGITFLVYTEIESGTAFTGSKRK
jgi:hypothetical protein